MTSNIIPSPFSTFSLPFPWGTPAVDSMICSLDARNIGIPAIVRQIKSEFPLLRGHAIPYQAVEKRILILDQRVELDYFKHGLDMEWHTVEARSRTRRAINHGLAIHRDKDNSGEGLGLRSTRPRASTESARRPIARRAVRPAVSAESFHGSGTPGRGSRLGQAIHKNHGETWEVLDKMKGLGLERTSSKDQLRTPLRRHDLLPRPMSPCRSDDGGRPSAVDYSLQKLRSFEMDRPSVDNQRRTPIADPVKMKISAFPKIPAHQPSAASLKTGNEVSASKLSIQTNMLKPKASQSSIKRGLNVLRKRPSHESNIRPRIHITKPSQERSYVGTADAPAPPHAM